MSEAVTTGRSENMGTSDLAYLHELIIQCPNPRISEAIKKLVDGWLLKTPAVPHLSQTLKQELGATKDELVEICWLLAINPRTPPSVLDDLCDGAPTNLLERIAENSNTGGATLEQLSYQAVAEIRIAAAGNPAIPIASIMLLVEDDDADVRFSIAANPNVPAKALKALAEDDNPYIKLRAEITLLRTEVERNVFNKPVAKSN